MSHLKSVLMQRRVDANEQKLKERIYNRLYALKHRERLKEYKKLWTRRKRAGIKTALGISKQHITYRKPGHCKRCSSLLSEDQGNGTICGWCEWDISPEKRYDLYFLYESLL